MAEINIELRGISEVRKTLESIPGGLNFALRGAIRHVLQRGKTEIARAIQARYNVPSYGFILRAIGRPRYTGPTSGMIRIEGSKIPLGMFPFRDLYGSSRGGVAFEEVKGDVSQLLHAFARGGRIYERETPARNPLRSLVGRSIPEMAAERTSVSPQIEKTLQRNLDDELQRLIRVILAGGAIPHA